jgi:hypothetical protein
MDQARARALLADEPARLQQLLQVEAGEPPAAELGDEVDDADRGVIGLPELAREFLLRLQPLRERAAC